MRSKSQIYSQKVFSTIKTYIDGAGDEHAKSYKTVIKGSAGLMRNCGLIQTLAFWAHKDEPAHRAILLQLATVSPELDFIPKGAKNADAFRGMVENLSMPDYMKLSREILTLMCWFRRYVDVLIEGEAEDHGGAN